MLKTDISKKVLIFSIILLSVILNNNLTAYECHSTSNHEIIAMSKNGNKIVVRKIHYPAELEACT